MVQKWSRAQGGSALGGGVVPSAMPSLPEIPGSKLRVEGIRGVAVYASGSEVQLGFRFHWALVCFPLSR